MNKLPLNTLQHQRGVVLYVCLLFLIAFAIISMKDSNGVQVSDVISANHFQQEYAFRSCESGARSIRNDNAKVDAALLRTSNDIETPMTINMNFTTGDNVSHDSTIDYRAVEQTVFGSSLNIGSRPFSIVRLELDADCQVTQANLNTDVFLSFLHLRAE